MSVKSEKAVEYFQKGYNCAQAVSLAFAYNYGIDENDILKVSCGFGGGMRNCEVCGAVTGAIMVIGMKYGNGTDYSNENKANCYQKTLEFTEAFTRKNQSLICRDLLGIDIFKGDGMQQALKQNLFQTKCIEMIVDAVEILEKLGY